MLKLVVLSPLNGVSQSSASQILMSYQPPGHLVKVILGWGLRCEFNKLPGEEYWGIWSRDHTLNRKGVQNHGLAWWLSGKKSGCQCRGFGFNSWVGKIPWSRKWQPTPVFLPGKFHGQRSQVPGLHSTEPQQRVRFNWYMSTSLVLSTLKVLIHLILAAILWGV